MNTARCIVVLLVISTLLGGCATIKPVIPESNAQAAIDREILEAARKIQLAQADLYQAGALNSDRKKIPVRVGANDQGVTVSWQGDALQLLAKLASDRHVVLGVMGMQMPLPVNIDVKDTAYGTVLEMLRAQVGYRAEIREEAGELVLHYNRLRP